MSDILKHRALAKDGFRGVRHDGFDPVTGSATALEHGRIGRVAWALFARGDGHILSLDKGDGSSLLIEIDTPPERAASIRLAECLRAHVPEGGRS